MEDIFGTGFYDTVREVGSLTGDRDRVRDLLTQGTSFDILYREDDVKWGDEEKIEERLTPDEAVNHFLRNASDFDGFSVARGPMNNLNAVTIYENKYDGILGELWPSRGDEMIFKYREK